MLMRLLKKIIAMLKKIASYSKAGGGVVNADYFLPLSLSEYIIHTVNFHPSENSGVNKGGVRANTSSPE